MAEMTVKQSDMYYDWRHYYSQIYDYDDIIIVTYVHDYDDSIIVRYVYDYDDSIIVKFMTTKTVL